jgi:Alpha/beta hydrolase domain
VSAARKIALEAAMPYVVFVLFVLLPATSLAELTKLVIEKREVFAEGHEFGVTGAYEKLVGKAYGEVDPKAKSNKGIVNIDKAPRNDHGRVEYSMDVFILKPLDMKRGNRTIFYDVVNRGNQALRVNFGAVRSNNPTTLAHAGDGFMMRQGYALVWSGWQGDMLPGGGRLTANFSTAKSPDGRTIKRVITTEFVFQQPTFSVPLSFDRGSFDVKPYLPVEESTAKARLFRRTATHGERELIPLQQWSFDRCPDGKAKSPSSTDLCLPSGFSPDFIYELAYEARDPVVMGLGFAATRDLISFLRYSATSGNPLLDAENRPPRWTIGFGSSQSGRFLKDLIYQGFNQDEAGRIVLDGAIPHISASRRTFTNYEFAMPGRFSTGLEGHFTPGDEFPFTYETLTDPISKKTDGWLMRCRRQKACPKIMHWDSGTESWQGRNSLVAGDPVGKRDAPIPDNVRLYYFSSTQHGPTDKPARGICQQLTNPLSYMETQRALLVAMHAWVTKEIPPPPTRYPRISDGSFVSPAQTAQGFPSIPGVRYKGELNDLSLNDAHTQPPRHVNGKTYPLLVPKVDRDGNEIAGIRAVALQVPLGTHSGWNLRAKGFVEDELCYLNGQYIPFAKTKAEREKTGDPRLSIEERYEDQADYVQRVSQAARRLVDERFLLQEDAERLIGEAAKATIFAEQKP